MKKIVSNKDYTLFFEKNKDKIECVAFENGKHMSGDDIGNILNISRQSIHLSLKKSVKKIYNKLKRQHGNNISTIEIMCIMADMFNICSDSDYRSFFKLFPPDIRRKFSEEYERRN